MINSISLHPFYPIFSIGTGERRFSFKGDDEKHEKIHEPKISLYQII